MFRLARFRVWWSTSGKLAPLSLLGMVLVFLAKITLTSASIDVVLEHANALYSEKKFADAREQFERATELDKGSLSAWRGLGWSHWALGEKHKAYQIWADLLKAFPDDLPTLLALGKASEQDQHWYDAIEYYAKILKAYPQELTAYQGKARVFIAQEKFQAAEQESRSALHIAPTDSHARSLLADALMGQGHYQEAEQHLQMLAKAHPSAQNLNRLGRVLAELGKYEEAARVYKNSLHVQADEDTLSAWRRLGVSLRKAGQNERAYAIWQNILNDYPNDLATLLALGRASQQDEQWQQSLDYYARVLQKAPDNQVARLGRAKIFYGQLDYAAAQTEVEAVLRRTPSDNDATLMLVDILIATDHREEAEHILRPMVELDPNPKYLTRLGSILAGLSKDEESAEVFQQSLQADPENLKAVQGFARVLWNQHRYQESTELLQNYLDRHPDNDVIRARLAEHASAGLNWQLAEREFRVLLDKHPEDSRWKVKLARQLDMAGRHKEATELAEQVVEKEANEVALTLLANNAIFSGDTATGIKWLKRITDLSPTPERLNQLGKLHIELGEHLDKEIKPAEAMLQYTAAGQAFQQAASLDPIKSRAPIGMIEALRLQKHYQEALQLANQLMEKYPNSVDIIQQMVNIYRDKGDYPAARKWLETKQVFFPDNINIKQDLAKFTFYSGDQDGGLQMLHELEQATKPNSVQVLLYHGVTVSERQDTVPVQKFRDQLLALKHAGYHAISVTQLLGFLNGKTDLPTKPILISFDDARSDSFQNADPILAETGFRATMFVPVGDVATHGSYTAVWPTLRQMFNTGRWDMQCHGTEAQHYIPVDAAGHLGRFMANRKWLADAGRQENHEEFAQRIQQDLQQCQDALAQELPDVKVFAFAFPYSDQGHRSLANAADIYSLNHELVKKQFQLAFHVDNEYPVTVNSPRFALPRFEVPRTLSGQELVRQLKAIDPLMSTHYELARLEMDAGHYDQALAMFNQLDHEGAIDKAELLTRTGKLLRLSGDHAGARARLVQANALKPDDAAIQNELAVLDRRLRPSVQFNGLYFEDNAHRSYFSLGPSAQFQISDRLALSAHYKYLDFEQTLRAGSLSEQHFQAGGNQFNGRLDYELGAGSLLSLSAGFADFSGSTYQSSDKTGTTFPIGAVKLTTAVNDRLELSVAADHNYVNTAGGILNGIALSTGKGGLKFKVLDSLSLSANHAYSYYTDHNQR
ncbi:MAG: tetratricopeptide repeat protein, partial [Methylococcales bacterium]